MGFDGEIPELWFFLLRATISGQAVDSIALIRNDVIVPDLGILNDQPMFRYNDVYDRKMKDNLCHYT